MAPNLKNRSEEELSPSEGASRDGSRGAAMRPASSHRVEGELVERPMIAVETLETLDRDSFDELLREVARASHPEPTGSRLQLGNALAAGRLSIVRRLGEGGMGVVYEAFDAHRRERLALKTLTRLGPTSIYRLKTEFRALAHVTHENLVRLHELFADGDLWFFTMELLDGVRFDEWTRSLANGLDEARLRSSLSQLTAALAAVHRAGKLHRDLKPSNVLVNREGRLVVLDFGLVADRADAEQRSSIDDERMSGTPAYMAPEQVVGQRASAATDLYALGVMLFESLTGLLPFSGSAAELLGAKIERRAPRVLDVNPYAPRDLSELCQGLLARYPEDRPSLDRVVAGLERREFDIALGPTLASDDARPELHLVGRERELERLRELYRATLSGEARVVFVSGESGMGKTAIVRAFLDELSEAGNAVVLEGRCHEREHVPFKAFDALLDDVTRHLRKLSDEEANELLPSDAFALARVFPVLARVPAVAHMPARIVDDPRELRRRAFRAFGQVVRRIRDRAPLVVFIDDLQWIDQDSVLFMRALLVDPDPHPALLILGHRSEGASANERLAAVRAVAEANASLVVDSLSIAALDLDAAEALARRYLPEERRDRRSLAPRIARESGGNPFLVRALAPAVAYHEQLESVSLQMVLESQLATLDESARLMLELSALAAKPLASEILLEASSGHHGALDSLLSQGLVRVAAMEPSQTIECYHHRIGETLAATLSGASRSERFDRLATVLTAEAHSDLELIMTCCEGAGRDAEAARWAIRAAERADRGTAFDHAAELFRKALQLAHFDPPERLAVEVAYAEALSNAGRSREAADAFSTAAAGSRAIDATRLRRRAAEELIAGGYQVEGESLVRLVCDEVGITVPRTAWRAMVEYGLSQARLRWMGIPELPLGEERQISAEERIRLEVARTAAHIGISDPLLGIWANTKYLLLAIRARDPFHFAFAFGGEAFYQSMISPRSESRIRQLYGVAKEVARHLKSDVLEGTISIWEGCGFAVGRDISPDECRSLLLHGRELLGGLRQVRFEMDIAHYYLASVPSRDLPNEARHVAFLTEQAFSLGRNWLGGVLASNVLPLRLVMGDLGARRHLVQAESVWRPREEMQLMDLSLLNARVQLARYYGDFEDALQRVHAIWPWYDRSPIRRSAGAVALMRLLRASSSVTVARLPTTSPRRRRALLATSTQDLRHVPKHSNNLFPFFELATRVALALAANDRNRAIAELRAYVDGADRPTFLGDLDRLVARRRLEQLVGGAASAELDAIEREMETRGVFDIERTTDLILPGTWFGSRTDEA